jgi:hypothetical protein
MNHWRAKVLKSRDYELIYWNFDKLIGGDVV